MNTHLKTTQIFMRFPEGRDRALTFSYDDGVEQDIRLMEILDSHGMKGTFNLNSGKYANEGTVYPEGTIHRRLSKSQATDVYSNPNHEVAVHGLTHPRLELMNLGAAAYDVIKDRENLEAQFGYIIRGMAYPYGTYSDGVVDVLTASGIAYARTTVATNRFDIPTDWLRMPATCHHNEPELMALAEKFLSKQIANDPPLLFYLWGHTYEFEHDKNWNVIEEFADYMAGHDNVWYATNIEIYEYIEDYNRLRTSADGNILHNPTSRTLWFYDIYSGEHKIAAGETIKLFEVRG